jgi:hypothetical protein
VHPSSSNAWDGVGEGDQLRIPQILMGGQPIEIAGEATSSLRVLPNRTWAPETEGQRPSDLDRMLKLQRALNRLAAADLAVHEQILEVSISSNRPASCVTPSSSSVQAMMAEA